MYTTGNIVREETGSRSALEAAQHCSHERLYGPVMTNLHNLASYLDGLVTLSELSYVLNMVDSRNISWIDCMMGYLQ